MSFRSARYAMILSKIAYLHAVEIKLVYTRFRDLKSRCGAKDFRRGAISR